MESLKGLINQIGDKNRDMRVIMGTVVSESPLGIQVIGDDKLLLNERITEVPRHLTDYDVNVDISGGAVTGVTASGAGHTHGIDEIAVSRAVMRVYNALKAGEVVYILSYNHGKKYFVLGRA